MATFHRYNQAQRMRLFSCEIMCGDHGVSYSLEISPILAKNTLQAALLLWKQHREFLLENISEIRLKPSDSRSPQLILDHPKVTFRDLSPECNIWSKADFISDKIVTRAL